MHDARDRNQGIWIEHNDRLYVAAYSSVASLVVMFSGYFRKANGEITEYAMTVNPTSDRAVTALTQHFGEGFLLSCVASLVSGNAKRGQCYVRAQVQRSSGASAIKLHNVVGGYVTDDYSPSFPLGKIEGAAEGPGYVSLVTPAAPAAGAGITITVPAGARLKLLSARANLLVSVTVGTRTPYIALVTGSDWVFWAISPTSNTASFNALNSWGIGLTTYLNTTANWGMVSLPDFVARAGFVYSLTAFGIAVDDQFNALSYMTEEWIEA